MVKQIINWTAGSFFRTLGRILLYITIGALIGLYCVNNNIKLPQWLIMIDKVDALTTITPNIYGHKLEYSTGHCSFGTFPNCDFIVDDVVGPTNNINGDYKNFCPNGKTCVLIHDWYFVKLSSNLNPGITYTWVFDTWYTTRATQSYYNKNVDVFLMASDTGGYSGSSSAYVSNVSCRAGLTEGTTTKVSWTCSFTPTKSINYLYMRLTFNNNNVPFSSFGCNKGYLTFDNAQVDAINNQTNIIVDSTTIINDTLNDLNDTIEDTDVEDDGNDMADFINDFNLNGSSQLSDLLTIPITFIQNVLVDSSNTDFCTTWRNKQICLPNGSLIWGRNDITPFKTFFNILVGGFLSYKMILSFLFTSERALNPKDNKIEVMKL